MRAFADRRQALEWAGVKGTDARFFDYYGIISETRHLLGDLLVRPQQRTV
jgi:hypothetical protein